MAVEIKMKTIQFGKFKFIETWVFPQDVNKFIQWATTFYTNDSRSFWCHICCGSSKFGNLRIDIDPQHKPDLVADIHNLREILGNESQPNIIIDAPWQINYGDRREWSYICRDLLKKDGILIFNAPWSPWVTGLELVRVWKVTQTFNSYRDLVDFWVLKKSLKWNI